MSQGLNKRAQSRQNGQAPRALCVTLLMASAACSASEPRPRSEPTDSKPSTPPGSTVVVELESGITFFAYRSGSSEWRELAVESENPRFEFDAAADGTYSFGIAYGENRGYAIEIFHAARDEVWHWWPGNQPVELPATPWEGPVSASIQNFDIAADGVFVEGLEGYIDFSMAQLRAGAAPKPFICQAEPCSWLYSVYDLFAFEYDEDPLDRSRAMRRLAVARGVRPAAQAGAVSIDFGRSSEMVSYGFDAPDIASVSLQTENGGLKLNRKGRWFKPVGPEYQDEYLSISANMQTVDRGTRLVKVYRRSTRNGAAIQDLRIDLHSLNPGLDSVSAQVVDDRLMITGLKPSTRANVGGRSLELTGYAFEVGERRRVSVTSSRLDLLEAGLDGMDDLPSGLKRSPDAAPLLIEVSAEFGDSLRQSGFSSTERTTLSQRLYFEP